MEAKKCIIIGDIHKWSVKNILDPVLLKKYMKSHPIPDPVECHLWSTPKDSSLNNFHFAVYVNKKWNIKQQTESYF